MPARSRVLPQLAHVTRLAETRMPIIRFYEAYARIAPEPKWRSYKLWRVRRHGPVVPPARRPGTAVAPGRLTWHHRACVQRHSTGNVPAPYHRDCHWHGGRARRGPDAAFPTLPAFRARRRRGQCTAARLGLGRGKASGPGIPAGRRLPG